MRRRLRKRCPHEGSCFWSSKPGVNKRKEKTNEIVSVRKCAVERGALHIVPHLQGVPWAAGIRSGGRFGCLCWRHTVVGGHGGQFARLGRGAFALRLSVHQESLEIAPRFLETSRGWQ